MSTKPLHLNAVARLVNGDEMRLEPVLFDRVAALLAAGNSGRSIIHALWTDDWGPPPLLVHLSGQDESGRKVEHVIEYRG